MFLFWLRARTTAFQMMAAKLSKKNYLTNIKNDFRNQIIMRKFAVRNKSSR